MKKTMPRKQGKLTTNNVVMEPHEYATINVLLSHRENVELVRKSRTPHTKSPDIAMCGMFWEIKSPTGRTLRPIERIIHRAIKQSQNVIIDLRRTKLADKITLKFLQQLFYELRSMRNLWIITKKTDIVKMKKISIAI